MLENDKKEKEFLNSFADQIRKTSMLKLTEKQEKMLAAKVEGQTNREIAEQFGFTLTTIEMQFNQIYKSILVRTSSTESRADRMQKIIKAQKDYLYKKNRGQLLTY